MADSDYTVAVVLQASDEGMSKTIKGASKDVEDLGNKSKGAKMDMMATVVALEGLTSGLNQLTGGMRKYSAALEQTGAIDKEQAEEFNKRIAMMEMVTGPMESIIALQKIATVTGALFTTTEVAGNAAKTGSIAVNTTLAGSLWAVVSPILVLLVVLAVLYLAWKHQEWIIGKAGGALGVLKDGVVGMVESGKALVDTLEDMARGLGNVAGMVSIGPLSGFGGD
tara:strand:- start:4491 stop:5162 length:672 start_codon:yes stop_codon:yes gene_type:complete